MSSRTPLSTPRRLEPLRQQVLRMGGLAERILEKALQSLWERSPRLAREVAKDDLPIDRLDVEIDQAVLEFLALRAPVAQDLRQVIAIKTAATDLERIGDIARNIAQSSIRLCEFERKPVPRSLDALAGGSRRVLARALRAFADYDSELARQVIATDDEIDEDEGRVFRASVAAIKQDPGCCEQAVEFILVGRNLERVGDHATNIAEDVILVVDSLNLKHAGKLES